MTTTTNYSWTKPTVGADADTWGGIVNSAFDSADASLKTVSDASLPKAGGTMTGALLAAVGAVGAPGLTFTGDTDTGFYRIGANNIGVAANGAKVLDIGTAGLGVTGTLSSTGATSLATSSGNVGIGTASPTAIYGTTTEVHGATGGSAYFTGSTVHGYVAASDGLGQFLVTAQTSHPIIFGTNDTERMRIAANGKVGIGNTSPSATLDVTGSVAASAGFTGSLTGAVTGAHDGTVGATTPNTGSFTTVTASGLVLTAASASGGSGFRLPHGAAPTSPTNGDLWTTSAGLYARINGTTVGPFAAAAGGTLLASNNLSDVSSTSTSRTNLGLGTAATQNTGTSGANIPLMNGANTWSAAQTFSGGASVTPPAAPTTTDVGYLGSPLNDQSGNYTLVMADAGKTVRYTTTGGHTFTIPAEGSVNYPIGTCIGVIHDGASGNLTIAITSDTLKWQASTGSRTLANGGSATIQKLASATWRITGDLLS